MKDLATYSEELHSELGNERPFRTFNRDISHAAAITCAAFRYAEGTVRLLSHKLDSALYGTRLLKNHVAPFLTKKGASLHILVETDIPDDHPIWDFIENGSYQSQQLKMGRVPSELTQRYQFNYLVVDDFGFRFERDRNEYAAVASFYESDSQSIIADLIDFFDELERESSNVQRDSTD